ncbi:uncharacterized protein [Ranitomeya imitator]|uniref:uncharacterized protein isoform X2 n=1 Tax=Ranitomeya imitator TaxID=111125 RepID=UPI0037E817A6
MQLRRHHQRSEEIDSCSDGNTVGEDSPEEVEGRYAHYINKESKKIRIKVETDSIDSPSTEAQNSKTVQETYIKELHQIGDGQEGCYAHYINNESKKIRTKVENDSIDSPSTEAQNSKTVQETYIKELHQIGDGQVRFGRQPRELQQILECPPSVWDVLEN